MENKGISILTSESEGYRVLMDFEAWRIGYMRHERAYTAEHLTRFQRHDVCDEAFVLLAGHCCLLVGSGTYTVGRIEGVEMEPMKVYNIHRGVWHSHLVDEGAAVLVVENSNVSLDNSPLVELKEAQRREIAAIAQARGK